MYVCLLHCRGLENVRMLPCRGLGKDGVYVRMCVVTLQGFRERCVCMCVCYIAGV